MFSVIIKGLLTAEFYIGLVLGIVIGYISRLVVGKLSRGEVLTRSTMTEITILVVTLTWFLTILVWLNNPVIQIPFAIHAMMGAVVGYLFKGENPIIKSLSNIIPNNNGTTTEK